ncbi:hypothetical protein ABPG74_017699 [Tetrahymena malaccensis]
MDTTEVRKNHQFDIDQLRVYFDKVLYNQNTNGQAHPIEVKQFSHGQSNPTFYINYRNEEYVLRKKPPGKLLKGAHLVDREYKIISALHKANFPVAKPILYCNDPQIIGTEFYVMSYVRGRIFRADNIDLKGLIPDERREIYRELLDVLVRLHQLDPYQIGLGDLSANPEAYYDKQIETWSRNYKLAETDPIKDMNEVIEWLPNNKPVKTANNSKISIVHGDYRLDNVIFHPTEPRILAVLDWELTALGNPIADAAYTCMAYYSYPSILGFGKLDFTYHGIPHEFTIRQTYCEKMGLQEISDKDWYFYLCFSFFRLAAISQGVFRRSQLGNASSTNAGLYHKNAKFLANRCKLMIKKSSGEIPPNPKLQGIFNNFSAKYKELERKLIIFMDKYVYPNEQTYYNQISEDKKLRWQTVPPILKQLQEKARAEGLWNLFLPSVSGLTNLEYAPLCEIMGRSFLAPVVFNCSAPDTGNMEVLHLYGTKEQKKQWLEPLLNGEIRSMYGMTEPAVASSDATNMSLLISRCPKDPENFYIVNGRKWWSSGAGDPHCKVAIVMGVTPNPKKRRHEQHSQILVPMDAPGVKILRPLQVFGIDDAPHGHMEVDFQNVRVPASNMILGEGRGFEISQGRLGPGRIHHCMRLIGLMERCYDSMCDRVGRRSTFGKQLKDNDNVLQIIGDCRCKIDQARLLTLNAARMIDTVGAKNARIEISMIKIVAPKVACEVIDAAIQIHGGAGVSQDHHLAQAYINARTLRLADGPDEVHLMAVAKSELQRYHPKL